MATFTPRNSKDGLSTLVYYNNNYYVGADSCFYSNNTASTYQCTCYAIGRSAEIAGESVTTYDNWPSSPTHRIFTRNGYGDAYEWFSGTLWEKTTLASAPRVGAIVCYGAGYPNSEGLGHVQIIEAIDGNTIYVSQNQTAYNSTGFLKALDITSLDASFIGYIYNPYIDTTPSGYTVTLYAEPEAGGYCTGGGTYQSGEEATFSAFANSGYEFIQWSDGYKYTPRYWTITESFSLGAIFKKKVQKDIISLDNSITKKAIEVLYGKYGNGQTRKRLLGKDYEAVQKQVNYIFHKYSIYQRLALQVLIGLWGNGATRKKRLSQAGYSYYLVQNQVNLLKGIKLL